jgi:dihydrofolate reductase
MRIRTHIGVSIDGYVATEEGQPAVLSVPNFVPGRTHGYLEFVHDCDAVVMGRTTFEPALFAPVWPWPDKHVFVLTRQPLSPGTPGDVVSAGDPATLVRMMRQAGFEGDAHLVGGPQTIAAFTQIDALDRLEIVLLPIMLGRGLPLSTEATPFTNLRLRTQRTFEDGSIELAYELV